MVVAKPIFVVAGVGNGSGIGASTARLFARSGYRVALIARNPDHLKNLADEINASGGEATPFPVKSYLATDINDAFSAIKSHFTPPSEIRVAVWNAGDAVWKPFLEITDEEIRRSIDTNIIGSFAFAKAVILNFQQNKLSSGDEGIEGSGKKGTLILTGATASLRGNTSTSLFSAGKFGMRSLSQSLNKEFGKQNIHVAHSIIDGGVLTDKSRIMRGGNPEWETNANIRLGPDSIANSYKYLVSQDSSALTWEIDLRPAHEKW